MNYPDIVAAFALVTIWAISLYAVHTRAHRVATSDYTQRLNQHTQRLEELKLIREAFEKVAEKSAPKFPTLHQPHMLYVLQVRILADDYVRLSDNIDFHSQGECGVADALKDRIALWLSSEHCKDLIEIRASDESNGYITARFKEPLCNVCLNRGCKGECHMCPNCERQTCECDHTLDDNDDH